MAKGSPSRIKLNNVWLKNFNYHSTNCHDALMTKLLIPLMIDQHHGVVSRALASHAEDWESILGRDGR